MLFYFHTRLLCACLLLVLFYDSSERKIPFPQEQTFSMWWWPRAWQENPAPEICPQQTTPGRLSTLKLGLGNSPGDNFPRNILLVPLKRKLHFKAKFSPFKNRTVTWQDAYPSKGLVGFNLLFLFYSQQKKDSLNMSNFFYHLTFQPQEKYSNIFKDKKKKKKRSMIIKKWPCNAAFIIKYFSSHCQQNNKNVCIYRENNDIISFY